MSERKPWAPDLPFTSDVIGATGGRLPTEAEQKEAFNQTCRDMIHDLHRDAAYQPPAAEGGSPRAAGTNGWLKEVAIGPPPGLALIDAMLPVESAERIEARKLLGRLMRDNPNDPRIERAKAALRGEDDAA